MNMKSYFASLNWTEYITLLNMRMRNTFGSWINEKELIKENVIVVLERDGDKMVIV